MYFVLSKSHRSSLSLINLGQVASSHGSLLHRNWLSEAALGTLKAFRVAEETRRTYQSEEKAMRAEKLGWKSWITLLLAIMLASSTGVLALIGSSYSSGSAGAGR